MIVYDNQFASEDDVTRRQSEVLMNAQNPQKPVPHPQSVVIRPGFFPKKALKIVGASLAAALVILAGYSIYIGVHEPDPQETFLLGQTRLAAGSPAAFRIVVRNRVSHQPIRNATVRLSLADKTGQVTALGVFTTDESGSVAEPVKIPELPPGDYQMTLDSSSAAGRDHIVKPVTIQPAARILLSSDKPIYQPSQTIHLRSLTSNQRTQKPFAGIPVTFEVSDPKGNKVFKETKPSSAFGIASADFVLADEVNLGRYQIRALAGPATSERTVEVKRYVLPKFKIQLTTDQPYYLPGQTVSGTVQAAYFFGQPAGNGNVTLAVSAWQEQPVAITNLQGRTDAAGRYAFQFTLPDTFAGLPQNENHALLDISANVTDAAQHSETKTLSLSVAQNELELLALPEAGAWVPGVENILYVLTAYPDGRPAVCSVTAGGHLYQSDPAGVCAVKIVPGSAQQQIDLQAVDPAGRKRFLTFTPDSRNDASSLLLRTDRAVYRAGQTLHVSLLSPEQANTVFLDVIKDGQTVLTKSVSLKSHQAEYDLDLPPSLAGVLTLNAYIITDLGDDRGCLRTFYVNPASDLLIAAKLSQPVFRPGETAKIDFAVTDAAGHPAPAALGLVVVDESVFALAENRPGLLQQFLDAEADLMKPRYQIKSFESPAELVRGDNQNLAQAYFASCGRSLPSIDLDALLKNGYLTRGVVDHLQSMRGTPEYESLRKDPQYAPILQTIDGEGGLYNLRDLTGPSKLQAVETHRKAYFKRLETILVSAILGSFLLLPILLALHGSRPAVQISATDLNTEPNRNYLALSSSVHNLVGALIFLPIVLYPIGAYFCAGFKVDNPGWVLLASEAFVVFFGIAFHLWRLLGEAAAGLGAECRSLRVFLWAYLAQFTFSRLAVICLICYSYRQSAALGVLWFFSSFIVPLIILASLDRHINRRAAARGIEMPKTAFSLVGLLVIIAMIFIMGAMLLPSLAKAKRKAQKVSLMNDLKQVDLANQIAAGDTQPAGKSDLPAPRIRRDFPETLCWRPELITDDHGRASLEIPLADSITTWRTSVDGVSAAGKMGSTEIPITVFQDFFADLDLPVSLSLGDEVSVPVTCYNYLKEPQEIRLTLLPAPWFASAVLEQTVHLQANEVKSVRFPITALQVGMHSLRVAAQGPKTADAIERDIQVLPVGERVEHTRNDALKNDFSDIFSIPATAIPGSPNLSLKFYPSRFSEVVEGLDSIFQAPYGCFEQTSSTTYPNVLVLDYLKRTGRLTPELEIKARKLINAGYQRLLTFEVSGGGFEWFGNPPANVCLTAYGVLEFTDMAKVHPVDEAVTERARQWLFKQQNNNGSWDEIHRGWTWLGRGSMTAFVAWALAESGDRSAALQKALSYLRSHPEELKDTYCQALAANAFLACDRSDTLGLDLIRQIEASAVVNGKETRHWDSTGYSVTFSHGSGMQTECTALCALALMKAGTAPQSVKQALTWLSRNKSAEGGWGSTQATILALRALIQGSTAALGQNFASEITVTLNGQKVETFHINESNSDVMKQINLTKLLQAGENRLVLHQVPPGELPLQIAGAFWLPAAPHRPAAPAQPAELLEITQNYDRTTLAVNDELKCSVAVTNNTGLDINMAIVDLGIPPGFDLDTSAFETLQQNEQLAKFETTGNQAILYLRRLTLSTPLHFTYSLRAKYPLRARTPVSAVYEYYQPNNRALSHAVDLEVK